jgi:EAL domain-containing protein (putative c-di-GMP-specific phosphodiesterase class I)
MLLSVPALEMIETLSEIFERNQLSPQVEGTDFIFEGPNIATTIELLTCGNDLSEFQLNSIEILVLKEDEKLDLSATRRSRTLLQVRKGLEHEDVAECLAARRIVTFFQPLIDLQTSQIYGYEALTRGRRSDDSLVPPNLLFDYAQENDAIFYLDRLTRETAIRTAAKLRLDHHIFINFMPNAIYDPQQCLKTTMAVSQEMNFDPSRIVFEVIETESIGDMSHLHYILDYYRERGYRVALDDVGSGYSSLNVMIDLKPDIIKIDREIVANVDRNTMKQSIFRGLTSTAKDHDILVVAEGIETEGELEFARANGADIAQGFYFARPEADPPRTATWAR